MGRQSRRTHSPSRARIPCRSVYNGAKFRTIFCKINERARALQTPRAVRALIGIGSNEAADRSRPVLYEAVDTTHVYIVRRMSYNSGCPTKKTVGRYPFAKHKLARSPGTDGIRVAFYDDRDPLSSKLISDNSSPLGKRFCRVENPK